MLLFGQVLIIQQIITYYNIFIILIYIKITKHDIT